jgi:tripartite-type tricarboxylate transporter receptor subunit TctC
MIPSKLLFSAVLLCNLLTSKSAAWADSVSDFYKGRTVTLIIGFPPGGGYDTNMRVLSRYIGKRIAGEPNIAVSNMPGAGSLTAANYLANSAPRDGSVLAMFGSSAAMEAIFLNKAANFDPQKFSWIGSMSQEVAFCGIWQGPHIAKNFNEMMTTKTIFGSAGTSAITYQHAMFLKMYWVQMLML